MRSASSPVFRLPRANDAALDQLTRAFVPQAVPLDGGALLLRVACSITQNLACQHVPYDRKAEALLKAERYAYFPADFAQRCGWS